MSLRNLLKNHKEYTIDGVSQIDFKQKSILYPDGDERPILGERVTFDITNENANPTFRGIGGMEGLGISHGKTNVIDSFIRGGAETAFNRRAIDVDRIGKFLLTTQGKQFLATQAALQLLNPYPQKIYNLGVNTLASVAAAGVLNIKRGGLLPFDIPGVKDDYLSIVGGGKKKSKTREIRYGLGDPGKPSSKNILDKLIGDLNPLKSKKYDGYDVVIKEGFDKVNAMKVFTLVDYISDFITDSRDFIPFRFEVHNPETPGRIGNKIIVFRAFLDSISDDYSANHNTYKYNGRGEEFYTYNKFARKIQVSFKIAAQSRSELMPLYEKLNYLVAQTAPNYSTTGRIRTPWMFLTVGDWFSRIPGLLTSVNLSWQKDYPWEIKSGSNLEGEAIEIEGNIKEVKKQEKLEKRKQEFDGDIIEDNELQRLPHVLDVSINFQPIHDFTPNNSNGAFGKFIGLGNFLETTVV
jgi:hypothetical protein